jgi:uncharacterized sulfatase
MGHDPSQFPLESIMATAEAAASLRDDKTPSLLAACNASDSAVRYWAAMGLLMRGTEAVQAGRQQLLKLRTDESLSVRVIAAQALGQYGSQEDAHGSLAVLLDAADWSKNSLYVSMLALNALDALDDRAKSIRDEIAALPKEGEGSRRLRAYVGNLIDKTLADLN